MRDKRIGLDDISILKICEGKVYVLGMRPGLLRDTYFSIVHDFETREIIEEGVFKRFISLDGGRYVDGRYLMRRNWLSSDGWLQKNINE